MQNTPKTPVPANTPANVWLTTYGPLLLSALVIVIVSIAWFLHDIDETAWLALVGAILTGNGLVSAAQWQAAPGLLNHLQAVIAQLADHIQALHTQQQQIQQSSSLKIPQAIRASTPPPTQFRPGPGSSGG
jgi:hypothetical protein